MVRDGSIFAFRAFGERGTSVAIAEMPVGSNAIIRCLYPKVAESMTPRISRYCAEGAISRDILRRIKIGRNGGG